MHTATILGTQDIGDGVVPAGDRGEQLVANLILSTIAFDLHSDADARKHLQKAHALANELAQQSLVYRPARPSQFARLTCAFDGRAETILLPVINNILVLPAIAAQAIAGDRREKPRALNITVLEIARFMLCLKPRRIAAALAAPFAGGMHGPAGELTDTARRLLSACIGDELPAREPFERANDCLTLARNLVGKRNFSLAALALENADRALGEYAPTVASTEHAEAVQGMKDQVRRMLSELKQTAM